VRTGLDEKAPLVLAWAVQAHDGRDHGVAIEVVCNRAPLPWKVTADEDISERARAARVPPAHMWQQERIDKVVEEAPKAIVQPYAVSEGVELERGRPVHHFRAQGVIHVALHVRENVPHPFGRERPGDAMQGTKRI